MDQLTSSDLGGQKVICLICKQVNSVLEEFNVKRHDETNHKSYDKFMGEESKREVEQFQHGFSVCIFPVPLSHMLAV